MQSSNIRVVCRVRPQNSREKEAGGKPCVQIDDDGRGLRGGLGGGHSVDTDSPGADELSGLLA